MTAPAPFTAEQQAYLQGFALGADVQRAVRRLPVLSGSKSPPSHQAAVTVSV